MSLYLGPELAALRQAELLEEAANERLARLARSGQAGQAERGLPIRRLIAVAATMAILIVMLASGVNLDDVIQVAGLGGPRG